MQFPPELTVEINEQYENCVSRVNPQQMGTELTSSNEAPPTRSSSQLELIHELNLTSVVKSRDKATITETEEDAPLNRRSCKKSRGSNLLRQSPEKTKILSC